MSLRQLKFKPKLQPSNTTTGVPNRCQGTETKKEQNEKTVPETKLPSARDSFCEKHINQTETNSLVESLEIKKSDSPSLQLSSCKTLADEQNFHTDAPSTKLKDTFGVSLRQLKFKPKLQTKKPTNNGDEPAPDKEKNPVKKKIEFEPPSPRKDLCGTLLLSAEPSTQLPADSHVIDKLHFSEQNDYVDTTLRKAERLQLKNECLSSNKTDKSQFVLQKFQELEGQDIFNNGSKEFNDAINNQDEVIGKHQLTHKHQKFRPKLNSCCSKIILSDYPTTSTCHFLKQADESDKNHYVNDRISIQPCGKILRPLSPSGSELYDLTKEDIEVADKYLNKFEGKVNTYKNYAIAVSDKAEGELSTFVLNEKNVQLPDEWELKSDRHILKEKVIDYVSSNVSHPCEASHLLGKAADSNKAHNEKEESSSLPVNKPSKQSSSSISEFFDFTKGDPVVSEKNASINFNEKREELLASDKLKLLSKHHKFKPKLNKPVRTNTAHNSGSSKQALDSKKDHTANENYLSFFTKEGIEDNDEGEGFNNDASLDLISPRIMSQRKRRKRLRIQNETKHLLTHGSIDKIVEYNESSSDSIEFNDEMLNRNESDIDSVKSVQTCSQKAPFKPKLDDRTKKTFSSSALGKFYSEAKQKFTRKFRNQVPDSSKLTMLDLIFYNPSSNPMPQLERKRVEEPSVLDNSDSEDNEKDCNIDSSKSETSEPNDNGEVPVPQLKLSADGKIVIAQESLVIEQSLGEISTDIEIITDNNTQKKKKKRKSRDKHRQAWSHEDTLKFYKALNSLGSDFETMKSVFPERSRGNLKSKFKKEEKVHGDLIDKVMSQHGEFNIEDVLDELEVEKRLADATTGKGIYVCKNIKDHQITINKKRKRNASLLSAKEITGIIKGSNKKHIDENVQNCEIQDDSTAIIDYKRSRTDYKRPTRHLTKLLQILKQKNWPSDEEIESDISTTIIPTDIDEKNDHIVISTNIEYDKMKYTQYISYNSNNLENPVEINETIAHD